MVRGAEYDDGVPHSDNAIEAGKTKVHGAGSSNPEMGRVYRTAELPEAAKQTGGNATSIGGSAGHSSGKGGHDPKTWGENKGLGAHKA
ncbi:hypothetical protein ETB97_009365 [Aspergillus alliaceus]|uniref:Uncharacterized protein n=1 Tax=Petromyces alliaceus TaxID=209559 RepID=A0A5N6FZ15_PETAA|nr:uncharacterized protein BDW43DRAFT_310073 [Aspergillus alliaceus]KAB8234817.1 hypothetical protein BDW43DRAFT_310073 [Aspergillus alliaceus]KAE8387152.1 hypothetical protein BDV23DRAFT_186628 [Aspergillus alliaceus]KAF5855349.1 hypothetical protein ETB97_009365 [Aspergillus burnettii]